MTPPLIVRERGLLSIFVVCGQEYSTILNEQLEVHQG